MKQATGYLLFLALLSPLANAQLTPMSGDAGASYYYTDHFEVSIDRPAAEVWPVLLRMGTWIPFLRETLGDEAVAEGRQFPLYDQFSLKVAGVIPQQMLLLVNLPARQEDEETQGVVMLSLRETQGRTVVSMFMSRAYFWFSGEANPLRTTRSAAGFSEERAQTYNGMLNALKEISEQP